MRKITASLLSATLLFSGCVSAHNKMENKSAPTATSSKPNVHKKKYLWGIPVVSVLAIGGAFLAKWKCGENKKSPKNNTNDATVNITPTSKINIDSMAIENGQEILKRYLRTQCDTKGKDGTGLATLNADGGEVLIIGDIHADIGIMGKLIPMIAEHLEKSSKNTIVVLGDMINSKASYDQSYDVLLYFFNLYNTFPERVVLLRGNHEDAKAKIGYAFNAIGWGEDGWKTKYWTDDLELCLNSLPLCCEIHKDGLKYFAVHGNISSDFIANPDSIENLEKNKIHETDPETANERLQGRYGLLNNHLCTTGDFCPNGFYGEYISMESVAQFCHKRGYVGLFRGHDPYYPNIRLDHEGVFACTVHSNGYYPPNNPNQPQDPRVAIIKNDGKVQLWYFDK